MTDRPPTPDELKDFNTWRDKGAPSGKKAETGGPDTGAGDEEHGTLYNIGRGLVRGVGSDIPGVETENRPEAGWAETGAYYTGKIAPFFTPMGEEALAAKGLEWLVTSPAIARLTKTIGAPAARKTVKWLVDHADEIRTTGGAVLKGARGGAMADPEHPIEGATVGAVAGPAGRAIRAGGSAVASAIPTGVKRAAGAALPLAAYMGYEGMKGHGGGYPAYYAMHHLAPTLPMLAGAAMGNPTAIGGLGSMGYQMMEGDDGNQP